MSKQWIPCQCIYSYMEPLFGATSLRRREVATMSSSVSVSEWSNLRIVFRTLTGYISGYRFIRSQTRRNSTTSTIAEAKIDITRSIFVRSRQRSTTYRLKRFSNVALCMWSHNSSRLQERGFVKGKRICNRKEDLFTMFKIFTAFKQCARCNLEKFDGLLRISTTKTNAEIR